jgi:DNA-binding beta-propeller fold protein YncE
MKRFVYGVVAMVLFLWGANRVAAGQLLYVTSLSGQQILTADTGTNVVTPVFNTVGQPDSLVFDTHGNIIYTNLGTGQVRSYNPTTHIDSLLASGFSDPADLALTPDGGSVLVSDFLGGKIYKVNLSTNSKAQFGPNYGGNPQGTAFDGAGNLFAVLGSRTGGASSFVAQLDLTTGAILKSSVNEIDLDGLTYDPFSGKLYSGSLSGHGLYQFDPATLSATLLPNSTGPGFDGDTTDAAGNLYIAGGGFIWQYNLVSSTLIQRTFVSGLDDLAPATGLGSPTSVPEPASVTLAALAAGLIYARRRKRTTASKGC